MSELTLSIVVSLLILLSLLVWTIVMHHCHRIANRRAESRRQQAEQQQPGNVSARKPPANITDRKLKA